MVDFNSVATEKNASVNQWLKYRPMRTAIRARPLSACELRMATAIRYPSGASVKRDNLQACIQYINPRNNVNISS